MAGDGKGEMPAAATHADGVHDNGCRRVGV